MDTPMQLSTIDMNLLVALDALLAEGSVTRAAARVGLSPSAMSHALARLRKLLDDPILLRSRSGLSPTPRARTLQPELREALDRIRVALAASPAFDPASSNQTFSVSCQDVTQILLIPRLLRLFETLAPGARLDVWPLAPRGQVPHDLEQGTYDVAIGQFPEVPRAIRTEVLFEDPIACLVRRDHPRIRSELTREQYAAERHLAVASVGNVELPFSLDRLLEQVGIRRRIVASVRSLVVAPVVVAHTDLVCTASEIIVGALAADLGVRFVPMPIDLPPQPLHLVWHRRMQHDPAHTWFRTVVTQCASEAARR
jgi:DNA-binding transcriptional LysR family regulator